MRSLHIRWAALLTALCLILTACGQRTEASTWQEQYDLGVKYLSEGNYEEAVIAFTAAIEIDPKQAAAYGKLADAYLALGDSEGAQKALEDGYAATGDEVLRQKLDEWESSAQAENTTADDAAWREQYDLGVQYLSEGDYEAAIIAFTAAIEIDPKRGDSYLALADVYISIGDYEAAAEILRQGHQAGLTGDSRDQFEEAAARYESILAFLGGGGDGIQITNLRFDRERYLAGEPTRFQVSVAYHCPGDEACVVMIGANTDEPDTFWMLEERYEVTGEGGCQFDVTVTPRQWAGQPFGIYVNLSEVGHGEVWTPLGHDILYLDGQGTVTGGSEFD